MTIQLSGFKTLRVHFRFSAQSIMIASNYEGVNFAKAALRALSKVVSSTQCFHITLTIARGQSHLQATNTVYTHFHFLRHSSQIAHD
jgi:hypothetical protein